MLFETHFIRNIPYVFTIEDPLWNDFSSVWPEIEKSLKPYQETATALILEPIVQGADLILENPQQLAGYTVYQKAVELEALLRPIGNTIYWLPPLNMDLNKLGKLKEITQRALRIKSK
jgi:adenosylmethionine-8-amino-7-oxononanoate aminotransferase